MSECVTRLLSAYQREAELYEGVLGVARRGVDAAREGRPLGVLHQLNVEKRRQLAAVEAVEREIEIDKQHWRASAPTGPAAAELSVVLQRLRDLIEEILECERETDRWIAAGVGGPSESLATS